MKVTPLGIVSRRSPRVMNGLNTLPSTRSIGPPLILIVSCRTEIRKLRWSERLSTRSAQSEIRQPADDNQSSPTRPHGYRPAADGDGPAKINSHEVSQRHQCEYQPSRQRECFLVHGSGSFSAPVTPSRNQ